ncbi:FHA domain-containing protein [Vibrio sp. T187]|uniref:type VI secretion system-associated FHA domain protein n=1 Tax=Vibrio TaxID=662 RepID=UPI0010C93F99|nr:MULTISPECIES: FHA domain-containing protein [Vibrio]MBW3698150.1 FHA domain-containing protein [Vibrio sp. T187]
MRLNQLVLFISKCPEEYTGTKQFEMPESGGSIGRDPGCTLPLTDHNRFISGTHCLVSVYGNTFYISDVSTNGTLVNGNKILKNQPVSICDGDCISLGQYEIGIVLEQITATQDIASDIAPERDSTDPLINLGEAVVEESEQVGSLEELFMETKPDEVDSHDPVAHLQFSMQRDDDHLIRNEQLDESDPIETIESHRQIVDDSFSIHSEFDLPNLIPEDWMAGEGGANMPNSNFYEESEKQEVIAPTKRLQPKDVDVALSQTNDRVVKHSERSVLREEVGQKWEEVTQPFVPSMQDAEPDQERSSSQAPVEHVEKDTISQPVYIDESNELVAAFYEGLGVSDPELISNDADFFKQMGTSLRLCIDNLQKELREVESLKDEQSSTQQEANLTELMLILNSQDLLAPHELVEQMLDELNEHNVVYSKALNELLAEQLKASDPFVFADQQSRNSLFTTKSKLWSGYTEFYEQNRRQLLESSVKKQIKDIYNKTIKGSHA